MNQTVWTGSILILSFAHQFSFFVAFLYEIWHSCYETERKPAKFEWFIDIPAQNFGMPNSRIELFKPTFCSRLSKFFSGLNLLSLVPQDSGEVKRVFTLRTKSKINYILISTLTRIHKKNSCFFNPAKDFERWSILSLVFMNPFLGHEVFF